MPRKFYPDTDQTGLKPVSELCYDKFTMFDGPGICKRRKGHPVDEGADAHSNPKSELHQEEYEGWAWNKTGVS
jgi:hypothetical protein